MTVLLLAGTGEARRLAQILAEAGVAAQASLAGATETPAPLAIPVRSGVFGVSNGVACWSRRHKFPAILDATHPFAAGISANAAQAARLSETPYLHFRRPAWTAGPGDCWSHYPTLAAAAQALPSGASVFLGTGKTSLPDFSPRTDLKLTLRALSAPDTLPTHVTLVLAPPGKAAETEIALFKSLGITHLVVKNAGGPLGFAKLEAARSLGLPVLVVDRPPPPPETRTASAPAAALTWLAGYLSAEVANRLRDAARGT